MGVTFEVLVYQKHAAKRGLYQSMVIFNRSDQAFTIEKYMLSFISCGSKEAGAKCIAHPVIISKGEN